MNSYGSSTANINSYGPSTAKINSYGASTAKKEDNYYGPSTAKKEVSREYGQARNEATNWESVNSVMMHLTVTATSF